MDIFLLVVFAVIVLVGGVTLLMRLHPAFGGRERRGRLEGSLQFDGHRFRNQIATPMTAGLRVMTSMIADSLKKGARRRPLRPLTPDKPDIAAVVAAAGPQLVWFGHSASLVRLDGLTILLDPMLGRAPSPFPAIGPQRYAAELPVEVAALPHIDAIVISHDHYDHLDYPTIRSLRDRTDRFFVPLGVAAHLRRWGVPDGKITELDWWQEATLGSLTLICTPSRHFSGRRLGDRFQTLWASWVIRGQQAKLYFSGDSGYGPHFKQIGTKYGPFDLTLMECGQYDPRWPTIHMLPEQTLQAQLDLGGRSVFPVHWGAFTLAFHPWDEPAQRLHAAAAPHGIRVVTPRIGEVVPIRPPYPARDWWRGYQ